MIRLIIWLLIGLAAGSVAKMLTKEKETGGWVSSLVVGIIGSFVGGFIAGVTGIGRMLGRGYIGTFIIATAGAFLVLFIYHRFLADKLNLKV